MRAFEAIDLTFSSQYQVIQHVFICHCVMKCHSITHTHTKCNLRLYALTVLLFSSVSIKLNLSFFRFLNLCIALHTVAIQGKCVYCRGRGCDNNMAVAKQKLLIIEFRMTQINEVSTIRKGCTAITMQWVRFSLIRVRIARIK